MKRTVSILLILTLIVMSAVAYATDYSSMTDEQLSEQFNAIRNELIVRGFKAEKKTVICEKDGVQIYINGDIKLEKQYTWDKIDSLFIPVVCVNNSSHVINIATKQASVNGWSTDSSEDIGAVPAGKKAKGNLIFKLEDIEVKTIEEFTDVEFVLHVYDENTWKDIFITNPITVYAE